MTVDAATIGWLLNAILIMVVAEAAVLIVWQRRTGRGLPAHKLLPNLAAGFLLMLSARLAVGEAYPAMLAALGLSLFAHLWDLRIRWRE
jgi:hypothetical protein